MNKEKTRIAAVMLALLVMFSFCFSAQSSYAVEGEGPGDNAGETGDPAGDPTGDPAGDPGGDPADDPAGDPADDGDADDTDDADDSGESTGATVDELKGELSDVKENLSQAKDDYDQAVSELKQLEASIAALEAQIKTTEEEIVVIQGQIDEQEAVLAELYARIAEIEEEVYDQNSNLNQRLRIMYTTGEQSVLAVLLNSENFIDFMSNYEMIRRIHESDKEFLKELEEKLDEVEEKKNEAEEIDASLKSQRDELQDKKDSLDADKATLAAQKQRVQEIRDQAAADIERLEKESKRIEQELLNLTSRWGDYAGGAMAWPVLGPVTSEFGMRIHPITGRYAMHTGIDIGVPSGTPVHAGADGYVYFSGWNNGGYGYLVMIDNGILNGANIVTLYAHNSALAVSAGDIVHRGDIIAYAGSTGNSTGPHVHFEVRVSGAPQNPRGWLG